MIRIIIVFTCFILAGTHVAAQPAVKRIRGSVRDSLSGEVLENATLMLLRSYDNVLVAQARSTKNGFSLRQPAGNYVLVTSFIGYAIDTVVFNVDAADSLVQLTPVLLHKQAGQLMEVVVRTSIPPVITNSDTLLYNAGSFKTRPNATVEELLKKLPGVQVDKEGNVTVQGKKVEKIYVDGKEFFLNDPKLATQNLLADMIDKVEAFDEKSDRARNTGITDIDANKVLNLRLKPDKKKGLFGKGHGSYGSNNRYAAAVTANYFKKETFFFAVLNSNNSFGTQRLNEQIQPGINRTQQLALNFRTK